MRRSSARRPATNLHTGCCFARRIVRDDRSMSAARLFAVIRIVSPAALQTVSGFGAFFPAVVRQAGDSASRGASPSQADDIGGHRQQNGDADGDNDQEEFSHCSASGSPNAMQQRIVLCRQANAPAFAQGPAIAAGPLEVKVVTAIRSRRRNSR